MSEGIAVLVRNNISYIINIEHNTNQKSIWIVIKQNAYKKKIHFGFYNCSTPTPIPSQLPSQKKKTTFFKTVNEVIEYFQKKKGSSVYLW